MDLTIDGLRVAHMLSFGTGFGAALTILAVIRRHFRSVISINSLRVILIGADIVKYALFAMWLTGAGLIYYRIVVLCDPLTARLATKLLLVTSLSALAVIFERWAVPELFAAEGERFEDLPGTTRLQLGALVGASGGLWISALLIGGFYRFQFMGPVDIAVRIAPILLAATGFGIAAARLPRLSSVLRVASANPVR